MRRRRVWWRWLSFSPVIHPSASSNPSHLRLLLPLRLHSASLSSFFSSSLSFTLRASICLPVSRSLSLSIAFFLFALLFLFLLSYPPVSLYAFLFCNLFIFLRSVTFFFSSSPSTLSLSCLTFLCFSPFLSFLFLPLYFLPLSSFSFSASLSLSLFLSFSIHLSSSLSLSLSLSSFLSQSCRATNAPPHRRKISFNFPLAACWPSLSRRRRRWASPSATEPPPPPTQLQRQT